MGMVRSEDRREADSQLQSDLGPLLVVVHSLRQLLLGLAAMLRLNGTMHVAVHGGSAWLLGMNSP